MESLNDYLYLRIDTPTKLEAISLAQSSSVSISRLVRQLLREAITKQQPPAADPS